LTDRGYFFFNQKPVVQMLLNTAEIQVIAYKFESSAEQTSIYGLKMLGKTRAGLFSGAPVF
jgi:hypothetical protein